MDPELKQAACLGDVAYLKRAVGSKSKEFLLSRYSPADEGEDDDARGNILHLALWNEEVDFVREAMDVLPKDIIHQLLTQKEEDGWIPLHVAANQTCYEPVSLILDFFVHNFPEDKPWLSRTSDSDYTALLLALDDEERDEYDEDAEKCAMALLSLDIKSQCNVVDGDGNSPLFLAVKQGFNQVAERILSSSITYSVSGNKDGSTLLHFAHNCSEKVVRILLEKHHDLLDDVDNEGLNVLHKWAYMNEIRPLNMLSEGTFPVASAKMFSDLIFSTSERKWRDSPLTIAARHGNVDVGRALVQGYQRINANTNKVYRDCPPLKTGDMYGDTSLLVAIWNNHPEIALYFLSVDSTLCDMHNNRGDSPLLAAIDRGLTCKEVVKAILKIQDPRYSDLRRISDGTTVLHMVRRCPEDLGKELIGKFWWLGNMRDDEGKTALDYAKAENISWMVNLLTRPSLIQKEPFDWIAACQRDENQCVIAFIDSCPDLEKVCLERKDTPLHHIKFRSYKECQKFLKMTPLAELKNAIDSYGATPLRRALERKDIVLAQALLTDELVDRNMVDLNLLSKLSTDYDDWASMCKQIKLNPQLRTRYIKTRTNLDQMRNTLSVVAALLATITFAAGFTLPGGLNSDTGNAMLAKKVSFIIFLLADAYAMSTSILVLFSLIWSMVTDHDKSYLLVDRSVLVLMQSLYGTMVAFMSGIYTVIQHSTLWVGIVIFVICSFIGISANRSVLHAILDKIIPVANQAHNDRSQSSKQVKPFTSRSDESHSLNGTSSTQNGNQDDHQLALLEEGEASTSGKDDYSKKGK